MTKTEGYIGLCMAAGGVTVGTDSVLDEVRRGRAKFVLLACDASERTKKQLHDKCGTYNVKIIDGRLTSAETAAILGRRSSCVAISFNGRGPWKNALEGLEDNKENEDSCMKG